MPFANESVSITDVPVKALLVVIVVAVTAVTNVLPGTFPPVVLSNINIPTVTGIVSVKYEPDDTRVIVFPPVVNRFCATVL